jgi:hypothetical protein
LRDSELVYEVSGGFAGLARRGALASVEGKITVEYRSDEPRGALSQQTGTLSSKEYLALWRELERDGLWTLKVRETGEVRTEVVHHTLHARVGQRVQEITWTDTNNTSDGRTAAGMGNRILEVARRGTGQRGRSALSSDGRATALQVGRIRALRGVLGPRT